LAAAYESFAALITSFANEQRACDERGDQAMRPKLYRSKIRPSDPLFESSAQQTEASTAKNCSARSNKAKQEASVSWREK
jgi:hypothetical protein